MFSGDEIDAIVVGTRWVAARGDARLAAAAENAVAKIRAVLPAEMRDHVDRAALTVPRIRGERVAIDTSVIRAAIRAECKIALAYRDADGAETRRTVWPFLVGFFDRALVLAAWCELRGDYRAFRMDRIARVEATEKRYPRRRAILVEEWRARQGISTAARN
jgi:predicted DNA-binding transcriptional regulator YafY